MQINLRFSSVNVLPPLRSTHLELLRTTVMYTVVVEPWFAVLESFAFVATRRLYSGAAVASLHREWLLALLFVPPGCSIKSVSSIGQPVVQRTPASTMKELNCSCKKKLLPVRTDGCVLDWLLPKTMLMSPQRPMLERAGARHPFDRVS